MLKKSSKSYLFILCLVILIMSSGCVKKVQNNVYLEDRNVGGLTRRQLQKEIKKIAAKINTPPQDAGYDHVTWEINLGKSGKNVNIQKTIENVMSSKEGERTKLEVIEQKPEISLENIKNNIVTLGIYSSKLLNKAPARVNNIRVASSQLNNLIIGPNEEFSFNSVLGPRTEEKGYMAAPIIINKGNGPENGYGVGGGICQLSSTLYNAVEESGLQVTERHKHSKDIGYVPHGRDATVVYDEADLKFVNTKQYPVMIKTELSDVLTVRILENKNIF